MINISIPVDNPCSCNQYSGTKTERNLWRAFINESTASMKYTFYASAAKKAGYEQMAAILLDIAGNEKEHAKIWYKQLCRLNNIADNLDSAIFSEHHEWAVLYSDMADMAKEEGFNELADLFLGVAEIEKTHEEKFRSLYYGLNRDEVFKRSGIVMWECRNCGHIEISDRAPDECPICKHPQAYYQVSSPIL